MKTQPNTLPTDVTQLQAMVAKLQQALDAQDAKYQHLLEQFRLAQHQRFGAHGEAHPGQGELFNEAEDIIAADDAVTDGTCTTISYERKQAKRMPLRLIYLVSVCCTILQHKTKSVALVRLRFIKSERMSQKSSSSSLHR
jgi:hypothetical protein